MQLSFLQNKPFPCRWHLDWDDGSARFSVSRAVLARLNPSVDEVQRDNPIVEADGCQKSGLDDYAPQKLGRKLDIDGPDATAY